MVGETPHSVYKLSAKSLIYTLYTNIIAYDLWWREQRRRAHSKNHLKPFVHHWMESLCMWCICAASQLYSSGGTVFIEQCTLSMKSFGFQPLEQIEKEQGKRGKCKSSDTKCSRLSWDIWTRNWCVTFWEQCCNHIILSYLRLRLAEISGNTGVGLYCK